MTNNQYTYQPPQGPMMPPQQPPMSMRQRMANGARRIQDIFPRWLSLYPIVTYILALMVVSFMYSDYGLPWYYMLSGVVAILVFFLLGSTFVTRMSIVNSRKEKLFERRVFLLAFVPRVLFVFLLYEIFQVNYGDAFGFENGDAKFYDDIGRNFAVGFQSGDILSTWNEMTNYLDVSDMGYALYVGLIYWLTGATEIASHALGAAVTTNPIGIISVRLLKCLWSALTVLLIYRLAKRNFGEQTARIAAIFVALWPNFWYYCGCHLKEIEMTFLSVLFVEQADQMLRSRQFTAWKIIPILLIAATMFTFRTPLGIVALLALIFSVVMSSSRVVSWGKRIVVGVLAALLIGVTLGNQIQEQAKDLVEQVQEDQQKTNMEWRATRDNANVFAKYAGKSVFAPLIFTIPFPSFVRPFEGQDHLQIVNGGNFVKNIVSFFTIFAMLMLLLSGKWREHLLPLSFMLAYLVVLTMSSFAQSERFHQPVMPFELMFAAYGISVALTKKKYKRWFMYWCVLMFIASIAWNWFKLAGRGLA